MKAFCTGFLGLQHVTPILRLPASPIGKEAVGKGEVIKSVAAVHLVSGRFRHQFIEASGYYKQESEKLSRQIEDATKKSTLLALWQLDHGFS
jgi:hypothetical protein